MGSVQSVLAMMGLLKVLPLLLGVASAEITCDECMVTMDMFVDIMTSKPSLNQQVEYLVAGACPLDPVPFECEDLLTEFWPEMGTLLYNKFLSGAGACPELNIMNGACERELREWTCEECESMIWAITHLKREKIQDMIHYLQGDAFCGQHPDNHECHGQMERLIPIADDLINEGWLESMDIICGNIANVCSEGFHPSRTLMPTTVA